MKESDVLKACMKQASAMGAMVFRNNTGAYKDGDRYIRYGLIKGSSDIIGLFKGRFLAIEVKIPGKNPTPEQKKFINNINKAGGIAFVARSADDVKNFLTDNS